MGFSFSYPTWHEIKINFKHLYQKLTRGFSDDELWNLNGEIAKWLIPRLKEFKKLHTGFPGNLKNEKEYNKILSEIIWSLEYMTDYDKYLKYDPKKEERMRKGLQYIGEYLPSFWD